MNEILETVVANKNGLAITLAIFAFSYLYDKIKNKTLLKKYNQDKENTDLLLKVVDGYQTNHLVFLTAGMFSIFNFASVMKDYSARVSLDMKSGMAISIVFVLTFFTWFLLTFFKNLDNLLELNKELEKQKSNNS